MTGRERQKRRDVAQAPPPVHSPSGPDALALAIEADDWDRVSLLVALGMYMAARLMPLATIDDVLALLAEDAEEADDDGA